MPMNDEEAWESLCKQHDDELDEAVRKVCAMARAMTGPKGGTFTEVDEDGWQIVVHVRPPPENEYAPRCWVGGEAKQQDLNQEDDLKTEINAHVRTIGELVECYTELKECRRINEELKDEVVTLNHQLS